MVKKRYIKLTNQFLFYLKPAKTVFIKFMKFSISKYEKMQFLDFAVIHSLNNKSCLELLLYKRFSNQAFWK